MKQQTQSITSLPTAPNDDRRQRMVKYSVAMGVRMLCVLSFIWVHSWPWFLIPALGAIFLPYFAVVVANVGWNPTRENVERPGAIVRVGATEPPHSDSPHSDSGEPRE